jgi:hypothetical protein
MWNGSTAVDRVNSSSVNLVRGMLQIVKCFSEVKNGEEST